MKKIISILFLFPMFLYSQSSDQNYIKTKRYKTETAVSIVAPTAAQATQTVSYMDGLGRPIQNIASKQSTTGKDIVQHIEYDAFGRQEKSYLPFVSATSSLNYDSNALTNVTSFYGNGTATSTGNPSFETTTNPYSKARFEASPLNRILEQAAVGNDWEMQQQQTNKIEYQFNTAADYVKSFKVVTTSLNNIYTLPTLPTDLGYYTANKLYKTVVKNENWVATDGNNNTTHEFKNNEGQVVLKRTFGISLVNNLPTNTSHDSYYIYDQFGNLTYMIPPLVDVSATLTQAILENLCYQYVYDTRNRLAEKKLPGKAWEYIVYDKLNRVVATGPAFAPFADFINLNKTGWLITKYDVLNRVVCSGWLESSVAITSAVRASKQTIQNGLTTTLNETKQSTTVTIDGIVTNYTNAVAPTVYKLLKVNYYDNYTFPNAPSGTFPTTILNDASQAVYYNNSTQKPTGLGTGSWIRALQTSTAVNGETSYVLYDNKSRPVRNYKKNFLGGYTQVDSKVDFAGKVLYTETKHKRIATATEIYVREDYTYTDQDRLAMHTHKIGTAGTPEVLSKNTYDELGQLISKKVGGIDTSGTSYYQKIDYNYNARGWLKGINNIANLTQGTEPQDLFAFKINYNTTESAINYTGKSLYNGNISETFWRSKSDDIVRKYGFLYDDLNRLRYAIYHKPDLAVGVTNSYNEDAVYDKNGNIMSMKRKGNLDVQDLPNTIDDLAYTYLPNSNRLNIVKENSASSLGFKDDVASGVADTVADYDYDANGNMKLDTNKGITKIVYNYLNLPVEISFANLNTKISYTYNAVGQKLQKIVKTSALVTRTTDYQDGFQYKGGVLLFFPTTEGYVNNTVISGVNKYNYVYNYLDHLGNVRMSYAKDPVTNALTILEENHYYPFGLKHSNYNTNLNAFANRTATNTVVMKAIAPGPIDGAAPLPFQYKFQGQERQDELGLNWDSFKWRNYDYAIGRFMSVDPLSEAFSYNSCYAFQENKTGMGRELEGLELDMSSLYAPYSQNTPPPSAQNIENAQNIAKGTGNIIFGAIGAIASASYSAGTAGIGAALGGGIAFTFSIAEISLGLTQINDALQNNSKNDIIQNSNSLPGFIAYTNNYKHAKAIDGIGGFIPGMFSGGNFKGAVSGMYDIYKAESMAESTYYFLETSDAILDIQSGLEGLNEYNEYTDNSRNQIIGIDLPSPADLDRSPRSGFSFDIKLEYTIFDDPKTTDEKDKLKFDYHINDENGQFND